MKHLSYFFFVIIFEVLSLKGNCQLIPSPSSSQTLIQGFGLGKITMNYSRPNVKGRKIFGSIVPLDSVWRTGANYATTLQFTDDITLEGNQVSAGEYSLFTIPGKNEWTIILNKTPNQWGAYSYKKNNDYLRFTVKPMSLKDNVETFSISFENMFINSGEMVLSWEHTGVKIRMTTDIDTKVMARIDSAMQTSKKPYYEAVIYYWNNNKDMNKALVWANELEKTPNFPVFVSKLWKARVLLKMGNRADAIKTAEAGEQAAIQGKSSEYESLNKDIIKQASK